MANSISLERYRYYRKVYLANASSRDKYYRKLMRERMVTLRRYYYG